MAVDERHRLRLADAAITLMELLPPVGWADVATKHDLRQEMAATRQDLRAEMTALELRLEGKIDQSARQLMTVMCTLMTTGFAATIAAVVGVALTR